MSVSEKQLIANQENAKKGGVKTEEGKAIVRCNARKHGLLAREVVITEGEGAESQEEFDSLLARLQDQFNPEGTLEAMLVEKIAVSYWRLRRAYRYESGLIRQKLDNATERFYEQKTIYDKTLFRTDEEIDKEIWHAREDITVWQNDKSQFALMRKEGKDLKETYDWEANWDDLFDVFEGELENLEDGRPEMVRAALNKAGISDDRIWQTLIRQCAEPATAIKEQIVKLEREKVRNRLGLNVRKMQGSIPSKNDVDHLLRYESTIERQFYKAMDQLERLQRLRAGENVPPPVKMSLEVNAENLS